MGQFFSEGTSGTKRKGDPTVVLLVLRPLLASIRSSGRHFDTTVLLVVVVVVVVFISSSNQSSNTNW
jgi:hypothetical protein